MPELAQNGCLNGARGDPGEIQNQSRGTPGRPQGTPGVPRVFSGTPGGCLGFPRGAPDTQNTPKLAQNCLNYKENQ